ncbi:MSHA biogenesis protein MshG [Aliidiomarina minuta]|uniref:MSHA biogenesis protein MshG n=1 Tax=Aliidiomarina minuta TaxID=880057 RepID=A0A432W9B2_9GAMM|nr:type II secretion system F family protein [Aliidiomarina minuta]RUO26682.1 MSHA biogenesis protein MshG [Aliidiomarina minuta]
MAEFAYRGRDTKGALIKGALQAADENAAAEQLLRRGVTPLDIVPHKASFQFDWQQLLQPKVSLTELIIFVRQMYSLTKAGIPMLRAMEGLAEHTSNKTLRKALQDITEQLERGRSMAAAMDDHKRVFPRLVIAVVHVGENTGQLEESFGQLIEYLEGEQETRKRIKSATRYPLFVIITLAIAVVVLNIFVIPTFAEMFRNFAVDLPLSTRVLIASSAFFVNFWWALLLAIGAGVWLVRYWLKGDAARQRWDRWKLKVPAIGSILERSMLARFCRSFAVMLRAGVPLTQALTLVSDAVDNAYMKSRIRTMRKGIEGGETLLRVSKGSELFTPLVLQMVAVGEDTGSLEESLLDAAEHYEREVDYDLKNLTSKLEPILIACVAGIVLLLAMGIFQPMWNMMSAYQGSA